MSALAFWLRLTLAWGSGAATLEAAPLTYGRYEGDSYVEYAPLVLTVDSEGQEAVFESRVEASLQYARGRK